MKKSGLQKKIAFIFENGSEPQAGSAPSVLLEQPADLENTTAAVEKQAPANNAPSEQAAPAVESKKPLDAKNCSQGPSQRPMPLTRNQIHSAGKKNATLITRLKKALSNKSSKDPRQKKMAMAAGLLVLVLCVVIFISFGGAGQNKPANSRIKAVANAATATKVNSKVPQWKKPEPLPNEIRDPMKPQSLHLSAETASQQSAPGELIVKGIVFSQTPSALVNNEIVKEGQSLGGVLIAKITKTEVEFEANGKRWTQTVQR